MKDIKLNLTKDEITQKEDKYGRFINIDPGELFDLKLMSDWLTLHTAHEADGVLIEKLSEALNTVYACVMYDGSQRDIDAIKSALSAVDAWRKGEE